MARVIGDTTASGSYIRVGIEKAKSRVYLKGFSSTRSADGKEFSIARKELPALLRLLHQAEIEVNGPSICRK